MLTKLNYNPIQALNGSPKQPPAIGTPHQFNHFTIQARPVLSNTWQPMFSFILSVNVPQRHSASQALLMHVFINQ